MILRKKALTKYPSVVDFLIEKSVQFMCRKRCLTVWNEHTFEETEKNPSNWPKDKYEEVS